MTSTVLRGGVEEALDKGYECTEVREVLINETVTTETQGESASGSLTNSVDRYDAIIVTLDGVEYQCVKLASGDYGAPYIDGSSMGLDWSEYPFNIINSDFVTQYAGSYEVKIEVANTVIEVSDCFEKAVAASSNTARVSYSYGTVTGATPTAREAWDLLENGKMDRVMLADNYELSSFTVAYLYEKNGHPEVAPYLGVEVYGTYYRFKMLPSPDEEDVLHDGTHIDVFHPNNTDEYYWVFSHYYAGKHE